MLHLRRFEQSDASSVQRLHDEGLRESGVHLGDGPWDDDLRSIPATYLADRGEFLVGTLDGDVVAMGAIRRLTDAVAEVTRMRVDAGVRRRGFARQLLSELECRARDLGYHELHLDTTVAQSAAQALYLTSGYRIRGRANDAGGHELILFEKRLDSADAARQAEVDALQEHFAAWAERRADVCAVALAGSWARGDARTDSDVDFVVLTSDAERYVSDDSSLADVAAATHVATIERGVLTEKRLRTDSGLEVDVGFARPIWTAVPVDPGTARVVRDGIVILFDPEDLLARLDAAVNGSSSRRTLGT